MYVGGNSTLEIEYLCDLPMYTLLTLQGGNSPFTGHTKYKDDVIDRGFHLEGYDYGQDCDDGAMGRTCGWE